MKSLMRYGLALLAVAALVGCFLLHGEVIAGGNKALMKKIDELAAIIQKGDAAAAESLAKKIAKDEGEVYEPMLTMKPRDKKGFGIGKDEGKFIPDGIELHLRVLARDVQGKAKLDAAKDAYEQMGYRVAAIAKVAHLLAPKSAGGQKTPENWRKLAQEMYDSAVAFSKAVKGGSPAEVKTAADKLNNNCNNCHSIFR